MPVLPSRTAVAALVLAAVGVAPAAATTVPTEPGTPVAGAASAPDRAAPAGRWRWPVAPAPAVVRRFDAPASPYAAGHRGVDLAVAPGTTVTAVADGVVSHAGPVAGRGTVTVLHPSGLSSTYEPVDSSVATGDRVTAGQPIGTLTSGGHCATACLHLGARLGRSPPTYRDPLVLLRGGPVVLLPL